MSNIVKAPPTKKSGLYKDGFRHSEGGIAVLVDNTKPVEVEVLEFKMCAESYNKARLTTKVYEFKNKTNLEVLNEIFRDNNCSFQPQVASSGDFILCRLVVLDEKRYNRTGNTREILDLMQKEKSCKISSGSDTPPHEGDNKKDGGSVDTEPVFVAPIGTIIVSTPSHRAKEKLRRLDIPFLSLYAIGWGGNEWDSLIFQKDLKKVMGIKGARSKKSLKGNIHSRRNNDALEKIFKEQIEKLENKNKPKEEPVNVNDLPEKIFLPFNDKTKHPDKSWFYKKEKGYETIKYLSGKIYKKSFKEVNDYINKNSESEKQESQVEYKNLPKTVSYAVVKPIRAGADKLVVRVSPDAVDDFVAGYVVYHPAKSNTRVAYFRKPQFQDLVNDSDYVIFKTLEEAENASKSKQHISELSHLELNDMIDLLKEMLKDDSRDVSKDTETKEALELLEETLSDKIEHERKEKVEIDSNKKDIEEESTLMKVHYKFVKPDKYYDGFLKTVWSDGKPPVVLNNIILDKYKNEMIELTNKELEEMQDKQFILDEHEWKLYEGEKEFVVVYVAKSRMNLRSKMRGSSKTWVTAKDREAVLKQLKNKKEFPDFGELVSIKPTGAKYGEGGDMKVERKNIVCVYNTDSLGLVFADKGSYFFTALIKTIDIDANIDNQLNSVLLFFNEDLTKNLSSDKKIGLKNVIGAIIPDNNVLLRTILDKHSIPFSTYEISKESKQQTDTNKINAIKFLSTTHSDIML
jgi:hypothetical protein